MEKTTLRMIESAMQAFGVQTRKKKKKEFNYLLGSPPYSAILLQTKEIPPEASSTILLMVP
jgi:hypothetical protein